MQLNRILELQFNANNEKLFIVVGESWFKAQLFVLCLR
jgi:hypothetical protein